MRFARLTGILAVSTLLLVCNRAGADDFSGKWKLTTLPDGRTVPDNSQSSVMSIACKSNKCQVETITKSIIFDNKPVKKIREWNLSDNNTLTQGGALVMYLKDGKIIFNNYIYEKQTE